MEMDRAVIIGTYESFGFYFSTSLLEEGYEVTGVHYVDMDEELVEKKRMEIGRNANFQEVIQKEWLPFTEIQEQTLIIVDLNYFFLSKPDYAMEISENLNKFLVHNENKIKDTQSKVICLLPIEDHESPYESHKLIQYVKASNYHCHYFSRELEISKETIKDLIESGF